MIPSHPIRSAPILFQLDPPSDRVTHELTSLDISEVPDTLQSSVPTPAPPSIPGISRPPNQSTTGPHGSISVRYQSNVGQVSSDVIAGEPLLRTSPLVVKADVSSHPPILRQKRLICEQGLPIARQMKVSPSRTKTGFFQTQGSAPLPHPPPIHSIYHPQPSDIFMHTMSDINGSVVHQIWVLSDVDGRLAWVVVDSPYHTTCPGNPGFVLSFNVPSVGIPSPTWVKPETARRHGVAPRLYQSLPHTSPVASS